MGAPTITHTNPIVWLLPTEIAEMRKDLNKGDQTSDLKMLDFLIVIFPHII